MITVEDVNLIALTLKVSDLSIRQIEQIVDEYPSYQKQDPSATWDLVIEAQIYEMLIQNS